MYGVLCMVYGVLCTMYYVLCILNFIHQDYYIKDANFFLTHQLPYSWMFKAHISSKDQDQVSDQE